MKRIAEFIQNNAEAIISEWENFADSLLAGKMPRDELCDHIRQILNFIARDMGTEQSKAEQVTKSHGEATKKTSLPDTAAEIHGVLRLQSGFDIMQMVSEYRALRASVLKLWVNENKGLDERQILDLIRFNEAIDQALAESVLSFTQHLDASKDMFLGILGHDLRNPLGAITMSAHLLGMKTTLADKQHALATQIGESAARIDEIITDLLDLTRARLGFGIPVHKEAIDFGATALKIVDEMRIVHPTCKILLQVEGCTQWQGDAARIEQVLSNLLGNAIQYGKKGEPITVRVKSDAKEITLSVHNTGVPIEAGSLATLFDSLVRGLGGSTDQRQGSNNLGLGLYIAKMIVVSHKGDLSVVSTEASGTTFTARFPQ